MGKIFISHSSEDRDEAKDLADRLRAQGYDDIFLDVDPEDGIRTGENWEQVLYDNLKLCRALIVLCSTRSMASRWCFAEITHARALGKNIFPIQLEPCQVFGLLKNHYQILQLGSFERKDAAYAVLWGDLEKAGLKEDLPFDPDRPYPGLDAFQAADAGVFFGRETEIEEVQFRLEEIHRWRTPRLAVVLGASGCGKSSLVRAGVLPRLERDTTRWIVLPPFRPGDQPCDELAQTLADAFPDGRDWTALRDDFWSAAVPTASDLPWPDENTAHPGPERPPSSPLTDLAIDLKRAVEKQRKTEGAEEKGRGDAVVLLVIDQFEELLKTEQAEAANAFLRLLRAALQGKGPPLMVLATLRSDFFGAFQTHPELQDVKFREWSLGPMPRPRLEEVIVKPASKVGITFEEGLVGRMIAETKSDDALPLLAFTLRAMWERCGKAFTTKVYVEELGGVEGAVARLAREIVQHVSEGEEEKLLRGAFLRMVRISGEQFVRRKAPWDRLSEQTRALLKPFIDSHLLVSDGETVEVTHEALFRVWDQLRGWLNEERAFILWRERLGHSLVEWKRNRVLVRGNALAEAENWLDQRGEVLDDKEQAFIEQSIAQREQDRRVREARRRRTIYSLVGGLSVVLIVAVLAISQWLRAEEHLNRATAQRLGLVSQTTLDDSYDLLVDAVLLAAESLKRELTTEGFAAWAQGMSLLPRRPVHMFDAGMEGAFNRVVRSVAFSPDGRILAVAAGNAVFLLDAQTRTVLDTLRTSRSFHSVAYSPDGRFFAGSNNGTEVWDVEGWQLRQSLPNLGALAFSPDGGLLAMASIGSRPKLVETTTWSERPLDTEHAKQSVAFSPDGKWLAMGGAGADGVGLWDVATGRLVVKNERPGNTSGVAFLRSQRLVTANTSGLLQLFFLRGDGDSIRLEESDQAVARHGESVVTLAARRDGRFILSGSISDRREAIPEGIARLWRVDPVGGLYEVARLGHESRVEAAAFNPVSGDFVTAARSTVFIWPTDPASAAVATFDHNAEVEDVTFSPDGRWLVAGGTDSTATVIETHTWQRVERLDLGEEIREVLFLPDGQWLVLVGSTIVRVYETASWREHRMLEGPETIADAFLSPKGAWLILLGESLIQPYQTGSWDPQPTLHGLGLKTMENARVGLKEIRFSSDGLRLATLTQTSTQVGRGRGARSEVQRMWQTWDLRTGDVAATSDSLTGRWQPAWPDSARQVSPDGRWRFDNPGFQYYDNPHGLFYLEDAVTGVRVAAWKHTDVKHHAFSPNSRWLATAGQDGWIRVWPLRTDDMIRMAGDRLPRNLSPDRFQEYFPGIPYKTTFTHLPVPVP